jgi:hypothetical protein
MNWPRKVKPTVMFGFGLSGFRFGWVGWGVFVSFAASGLVTVTRGSRASISPPFWPSSGTREMYGSAHAANGARAGNILLKASGGGGPPPVAGAGSR